MLSKKYIWAIAILWVAFIFTLSSQVAEQSKSLSTGITKLIIDVIEYFNPDASISIAQLNHQIRKAAHFSAYLILGILISTALRKSGVRGFSCLALSLAICIFFAITDEIHQLYVPGRGGQVMDVLIDSAGAAVGIVLTKISCLIKTRWGH